MGGRVWGTCTKAMVMGGWVGAQPYLLDNPMTTFRHGALDRHAMNCAVSAPHCKAFKPSSVL